MELFVYGYLNPYSKGTGNISYEEGSFSVEELHAEVVRGLPIDVQIKAGKYLVGFGQLNIVHPHAWHFVERPLAHDIFFGPDGFNDMRFNFSFVIPTNSFYSNLDLGIIKGDVIGKNEVSTPDESASAHGINSRLWLLIFYIVVGMGISLTTRFVGDVFTFAYLIIPSSIGILLAKKAWQVFLIAVMVGSIIPPISIFLAFKYDFSSGPAAVVSSFILFLIVYLFVKIKG